MQRPVVIASGGRNPTARPVVVDIGILGGVVLSNVLFDRVIRPNFHPFVLGLYHNARNAYPYWILARDNTAYFCERSAEVIRTSFVYSVELTRTLQHYIRLWNSELIRGITVRVYPFVFDKIRRLYIWMSTRREIGKKKVISKAGPGPTRINRNLDRVSFRYIPEIDQCELDDCNEDGLIHAYEKSESTSDTESEEVWSQIDPEEEEAGVYDSEAVIGGQTQWGTIDMTSFDPRKNARSSTPVKLTFPKETVEETSQLQQSEAKVAALEVQLNEMKAMIALILENQNKTIMSSDANKTVSEVIQKPCAPTGAPPPPPPPPPPMPMPQTPLSSGNTQLKLKVGRKSGSLNSVTESQSSTQPKQEQEIKSMTDVLKGLSKVKLRPTARSPGGTPLKRQKTMSPNDPTSMIALALKKRFARIHSPSDSEPDDDRRRSNCNKENENGDDSFDNSPLFRKSLKLSRGSQKRSSLLFPPAEDDLKVSVIPEVNESSLSGLEDSVPTKLGEFGQHLLKPSRNSPTMVLGQTNVNSPLREKAQNVN